MVGDTRLAVGANFDQSEAWTKNSLFLPFVYLSLTSKMSGQLKRFDAYAKTLDDFRVRTTSGGLMTIASSFIICLLFILELKYYLTIDVVQVLFVDTSRQEKMNISIDIHFPVLPCSYLTIDAMDISGDAQTDIIHNLFKTRLDLQGNVLANEVVKVSLQPLAKAKQENVESTTIAACESCYGAESAVHKCCPTCDDVKSAYRVKGWSFDASEEVRIHRRFHHFSFSRRSAMHSRRQNDRYERQ